VTGKDFIDVLNHAKHHGYAIPAVNCTMSSVSNASMVGRCRLTVSKPELKARLVSALETKT